MYLKDNKGEILTLLHNDIIKLIPHRHPFLFVDTCKIIDVGLKGISTKKFLPKEYFFEGLFPLNQWGTLDAQASQLKAAISASPFSTAKIERDEPL